MAEASEEALSKAASPRSVGKALHAAALALAATAEQQQEAFRTDGGIMTQWILMDIVISDTTL